MNEPIDPQDKTDTPPERDPEISLVLTVVPGTDPSVLDTMAPHVDELIVTFAIVDDQPLLDRWIDHVHTMKEKKPTMVEDARTDHPEIFALDSPETFQENQPLVDETYPGPFTNRTFVCDWSALRNLGLSRCTKEWRISLRSNEVVEHPEALRSLCANLAEKNRDVAHLPHRRGPRSWNIAQISRNLPQIYFEGTAREILVGDLLPAVVVGWPSTREPWSAESDAASDRDSLRCLYLEGRRSNWLIPPLTELHLARSAQARMPDFADSAALLALDVTDNPIERAWGLALRGEISEARGNLKDAGEYYESSLAAHPTWKTALRLCRTRLQQKKWNECLEAYERASSLSSVPCLLDDGDQDLDLALLYVASAHLEMGRERSRATCAKLLEKFPGNSTIAAFCRKLDP
jgi:hypothetical protein